MLRHSYITNSQISALLPLIAICDGYGEARERNVDCKADRAWAQRRLQGGQSESAASAAKVEKRVDATNYYRRFATAMGKLVSAVSTARRTERGRSAGRKADRAWAQRRLQGGQSESAASAAKVEKRVDATSAVAGTICDGYGEARERNVDCKADRAWAQRRLQGGQSESAASAAKVEKRVDATNYSRRFATAMGKLVSAVSTARRTERGRSAGRKADRAWAQRRLQGGQSESAASAAKVEKRVDATSAVAGMICDGYGEARERNVDCKADRAWAQRRLQGGQSESAASAAKVEKRVDATNYYRRFATAMGKLVSAVSTARRTERGRSAGRKADRAWAQRRLQGGQSESAASAAKVEKRVDATPAVAGIILYGYGEAPICDGYGEARERNVDCKADRAWAQRRLQGGQSESAASAAKVEKRVDATSAVAGTICDGYGEARERGVDCKADRAWAQRRPQGGQSVGAASAARRTERERSVGCQGGKARRRDKLFQGKLQIKVDRVDELGSGYKCSNVTFPTAMGKLKLFQVISYGYGQALTYGYGEARERSVDCKADRAWAQRRLQGGQSESAASAAKVEKRVDATSAVAGMISYGYGQALILYGYGEARERGVDCKADRLWARRRLQGGQSVGAASAAKVEKRVDVTSAVAGISYGYGEARERGVDCKADRSWARRRLQGGQSVGAASAAKLEKRVDVTSAVAGTICDGYGEARERGVDCKADRAWAQRRPQGGQSVGAASAARRTERERSVGCQGGKARRRDVSRSGYYTTIDSSFLRLWEARERGVDCKADRSWARRRLQGGQSVGAASAAKLEKRVDATSAVAGISYGYGEARERGVDGKADRSWARRRLQGGQSVGAASAAKLEKRVDATSAVAGIILYGYGEARERGVDCKADLISTAMGKLVSAASTARWTVRGAASSARRQSVGAASAAKVEKRVDATSAVAGKTIPGKFQIKADRVDALDSGYECSKRFATAMGKLVSAVSTARRTERGRSVVCKADRAWAQRRLQGGQSESAASAAKVEKRVDATSAVAGIILYGYGEARERGVDCKADLILYGYGQARERGVDRKVDSSWRGVVGKASRAWVQRRLPRWKSALLHWFCVETIPGKFQIKADRVDALDSGYECSKRFATAMGKLVSAVSTARRTERGRSVVCKADRAWAQRRLQGGQSESAASAAKVEKRVDATSAVAGIILYGYGEARERGVDCKADRSWARRRLQGGQSVGAASAAKLEKRVDVTSAVAGISYGYGEARERSVDCKADIISYGYEQALTYGYGEARERGVDCKADRAWAQRRLQADRAWKLFQVSYGYGEARERGVDCKADRAWAQRRLQGGRSESAASATKVEKRVDATSAVAGIIFYGYGQARERGVDCKADISYGYGQARERGVDRKVDRSWARRRLQGGQSVGAASAAKVEKRVDATSAVAGKSIPGYTTIDSSFLRLWEARERGVDCKADRAWAQRRLQGGQSESAASATKVEKRVDATSAVAGISYGYGEARERGVDCKADRAWAQRRLQGGRSESAASAAKVEKRVDATSAVAGIIFYGYGQARERGVDCKADSSWARRRLQGGQSVNAASAAKADRARAQRRLPRWKSA
ncbi:hypothetical protein GN244_ATG20920 [Phytophthora infestans]|uniref:Uncharacterized protein n=1 Tax=Phytophthora infestans TaxID=4787 RepID=A0A833W2U1_PHYIN|nr:hypothetical protein GN244_ATG20920 [Phytophthora infestans]